MWEEIKTTPLTSAWAAVGVGRVPFLFSFVREICLEHYLHVPEYSNPILSGQPFLTRARCSSSPWGFESWGVNHQLAKSSRISSDRGQSSKIIFSLTQASWPPIIITIISLEELRHYQSLHQTSEDGKLAAERTTESSRSSSSSSSSL